LTEKQTNNFFLLLWILLGVIFFIWFILTLIFGFFRSLCRPSFYKELFRDLCRSPVTPEDEANFIHTYDDVVEHDFKKSPKPPSDPEKPHTHPEAVINVVVTVHDNIESEYKIGLFSKPGTYKGVVRLSDSVGAEEDRLGVHGFALKVCGVNVPEDQIALFSPKEAKMEQEEKLIPNHYPDKLDQELDFLALAPIVGFVAANIREFTYVSNVKSIRQICWLPTLIPIFGYIKTRRWAAWQRANRGPLGWSYGSQGLSRFGQRHCKFYFLPDQEHPFSAPCCGSRCCRLTLRAATTEYLKANTASFGLYIQLRPESKELENLYPIDDLSVLWDDHKAPLRRVATVSMPKQDTNTDDRWKLADRLSYNPFQNFKDMEPVGDLARAREHIYLVMSKRKVNRLGDQALPKCPFHFK